MNDFEGCVDCLFAHRLSAPYDKQLECRRRAPTGNKHAFRERLDWPFVKQDDWCGEFKALEPDEPDET